MTKTYQPGTLAPLIPEKATSAQKPGKANAPIAGSRKMMPLIPPPPAPVVKEYPARNPMEVGLMNLSGLGLGYLFTKRWLRWVIYLIVTVGLVIAAFVMKAHKTPWLWAGLFILLLLWMAFDGWRVTRKTNQLAGKTSVKWKTAGIAIGVAALLIVAGLYTGYALMGKSTFNKGVLAYTASDCNTAEKYFKQVSSGFELTLSKNIDTANERIQECDQIAAADKKIDATSYEAGIAAYQVYLTKYPNNPPAKTVKNKIGTALLNWGMALRTSGKYEEAIGKFQTIKEEYPEATVSEQVENKIAETTLQWAQSLRRDQDYTAALAKYKLIIKEFAGTATYATANDEIVKTYAEYSAYLRNTGKYQEAIAQYENLKSGYPLTPEGKTATNEIGKTYLAWSGSLTRSGDFNGAMEMITTVKESVTDTTLLSTLDEGYQEALTGLSEDSGSQGSEVISDTLAEVCGGKKASSPAVGISNGPGKAQFCDYSGIYLPSELTVATPGEFRYVLKFDSGTNTQTCPTYYGGSGATYNLYLSQEYWVIRVVNTLTGQVEKSRTFLGDAAGGCPETHEFYIGTSHDTITGGGPDENAVIAWLKTVLK